jgi:uncharacterized protein (DUF362 family)
LDESLVDISMTVKPTLTILDAVRILTANGPQGGSLSDVKKMNTVIAGIDQVAVDSFGATLFGMKGSDLGYVRSAPSQAWVWTFETEHTEDIRLNNMKNAREDFTGTVPALYLFLFFRQNQRGLDELGYP